MRIDLWRGRGPGLASGLLIALLASTAPAAAQDPKPARPDSPEFLQPGEVRFTAKVEPTRARPGQEVTYSVSARVEEPWHIYAHAEEQPKGVAAVPTRFDLFRLGGLEPTGEGWEASEEPVEPPPLGDVIVFDYHEGAVTWSRKLRVPDDAAPGAVSLQGQVMFQLCTDSTCKPPTRRTVDPVGLTIEGGQSRERLDRPSAALAGLASPLLVAPQDEARPQRKDSPPILQPKEATFTTSIEPAEAKPGDSVNYNVSVKLAPTWHIYAYAESIPEGVAAVPTRFDAFGLDGLEKAGEWAASREPHEPEEVSGVLAYKYYEDEVTWTLPLKVPADAGGGERSVRTQIQFQICDPKSCKPPTRVTLPAAMLTVLASPGGAAAPSAGPSQAGPSSSAVAEADSGGEAASGFETEAEGDAAASASTEVGSTELREKIGQGLIPFMLWSALGGVVALMMPCVWPMIPITVNFFVKQGQPEKGKEKKSTTGLAITYCLAIIGVFTLVGVVFSAAFGATALNQLSNAPWLNFVVAGLFLAFGLSLLGLFEIRLPNFLLNASAQGESRGGVIGVIFMALTLTITSFTCTFPVVGALLVVAAGGSYLYPVIGLATFATVLALPFFLLALAPGILSNMPRSGDWMNAVKVVGGLVEIGAAFKFLNTAEVSLRGNPEAAWFDAQVLMASWVVIAAVCGFYLLGFFRTSHDHGEPSVGVGRLLFGSFFLFVALYFSPALFGYPPRSKIYDRLVVGLLPADAGEMNAETELVKRLESIGFSGGGGASEPQELIADSEDPPEVQRARSLHGVWWDMSLDVALAKAKESNRPVLIDFTGVNCANCRSMEQGVMPKGDVIERLRQFVPVQLYVDRVPVEGLGADRSEELAIRNFERELELTDESTQPLYVVMTPDGEVVSSKGGLIERPEFISFLDRALAEYSEIARTAQAGE
ncbi:protein-disulfide reductase DsbD family protein [Tautonia plasticadhaerens]|nr:cytochrome c biogenesis protein CcdA [Tautonia plasticadhaerens]